MSNTCPRCGCAVDCPVCQAHANDLTAENKRLKAENEDLKSEITTLKRDLEGSEVQRLTLEEVVARHNKDE